MSIVRIGGSGGRVRVRDASCAAAVWQ